MDGIKLYLGPSSDDEDDDERGVKISDDTVRKFRVGKVFKGNTERINHMNFSSSGDLLISSAEDDQIIIYDCEKATPKRILNSKKYGVDLIHFTHARNTAVHSSTKINDTIRYLSLHDNKYLRYFPGHTKKVTTLCMSPTDDTLLSGSLDNTLRLWDLGSPNCQGLMRLQGVEGKPVAAFDPDGVIFAAGINSECIMLYDKRSFDKGPFTTFRYTYEKENEWSSLKFSPDGKFIMICSNGSVIRLIDAFQGTPLQTFAGFVNTQKLDLEATFSPDSQFVLSGSGDGVIHVWNAKQGFKVCVLNEDHQHHPGPVQCIQFNPKFMMMATACTNMAFWLPQDCEDQL